MNKFLVYTSNLDVDPRDMRDVIEFAKETPKFYICNVELNSHLQNVKEGDMITTTKGNRAYILRTFDRSLEDLSSEDRAYVDELTTHYGMRKANISGVASVTRLEYWCKTAKPLVKSTKTTKEMKNTNSIRNFADRIKEKWMPAEAEGVRISVYGEICVCTPDGYVTVDDDGLLSTYPEEMTMEFPLIVFSKPKEQLMVGDVVCHNGSYYKVMSVNGTKIRAINYQGSHSTKTINTVRDILFNQTAVRVVMNPLGAGMGMNPMMMALSLSKSGGNNSFMESLLPFMMMQGGMMGMNMNPAMQQQGGMMGMNPMMMALALSKGEGDGSFMESLLPFMMMQGGMMGMNMNPAMGGNGFGPFGNMGGGFGCQAPTTNPTYPGVVPEKKSAGRPRKKGSKAATAKAPKISVTETEEEDDE